MPELLAADLPSPAGGAFTTRAGGVSQAPYDALNLGAHVDDRDDLVRSNRARLAAAVGLAAGDVVAVRQVHGTDVTVVDRQLLDSSPGGLQPLADADALVTREAGVGLMVLAADCLPLLLADGQARVVGAVHAGRQGLAAGVVQAALEAMQSLGATAGTTSAVLGPAACGRCYEVPAELAEQVEQSVPASRSTTSWGTDSIDLTAGATALLRAAGVTDVRAVGGCTLEQPERFFSYRRDGRTGRHGGVVWLRP